MADNKITPSSFSPTPAQPTSVRFIDLPQELRDDMPTSSSKKPRGRPPGSKNRPKPPVIIEENMDNNMKMIYIEIPVGKDIVGGIINCAQRHQASITVSRGYGLVTDVTLLNPETHFPTPPIKGPFEMTSLLGTYMNINAPPQFINDPPCSCFSILLSGHGAVVYAGTVGGTIIAASDVWIEATLCKNIEHYQAVSNNNDNNYNYNNYNNVVNVPSFDVATFPNHQNFPPHLPTDENVMQCNHSSHIDN